MNFGKVEDMNGATRVIPHRDLILWRRAMELMITLQRDSRLFLADEINWPTQEISHLEISDTGSGNLEASWRNASEVRALLRDSTASLQNFDARLRVAYRLNYIDRKRYANLSERIDQTVRLFGFLLRSMG